MATFNITTGDGKLERIEASNAQVAPDGSLICSPSDGNPPTVFNGRWWRKIEPAAIQGKLS